MKTYEIRTDWRNANGETLNGSDERVISEHATLAEAVSALAEVEPSHPHNHAQIWHVCDDVAYGLNERTFAA